jgi:hypothetical protein
MAPIYLLVIIHINNQSILYKVNGVVQNRISYGTLSIMGTHALFISIAQTQ